MLRVLHLGDVHHFGHAALVFDLGLGGFLRGCDGGCLGFGDSRLSQLKVGDHLVLLGLGQFDGLGELESLALQSFPRIALKLTLAVFGELGIVIAFARILQLLVGDSLGDDYLLLARGEGGLLGLLGLRVGWSSNARKRRLDSVLGPRELLVSDSRRGTSRVGESVG